MAPERPTPVPAVRRLAGSRLISLAGTQAAYIALLALVYDRSQGSGSWLAAALIAALVARVAVSPWAGSLGDRFDRRRVMIASDVAAAACFLVIAQVDSLVALVALSAAASIAEAPFSPASSALVAMIVPAERRGWANGVVSASSSAGMLIGAPAGRKTNCDLTPGREAYPPLARSPAGVHSCERGLPQASFEAGSS